MKKDKREIVSRFWLVRTATHVFDYDEGYTEVSARDTEETARAVRHYGKMLMTEDAIRDAKKFLGSKKVAMMGGRVWAVRITVYKGKK